jgi:hypothetical protein
VFETAAAAAATATAAIPVQVSIVGEVALSAPGVEMKRMGGLPKPAKDRARTRAMELFLAGNTCEAIAAGWQPRPVQATTILAHVATAVKSGDEAFLLPFLRRLGLGDPIKDTCEGLLRDVDDMVQWMREWEKGACAPPDAIRERWDQEYEKVVMAHCPRLRSSTQDWQVVRLIKGALVHFLR